jgi:hypothetical protein
VRALNRCAARGGLPSGQCAVTSTALLSAACPGVGRRLQAYGTTQVIRLLVHGCKSSVLGVSCGDNLWQPEQGAAFAVWTHPHPTAHSVNAQE